jgi:hypothetical protein
MRTFVSIAIGLAIPSVVAAQHDRHAAGQGQKDSAFHALQQRGKNVMGVDQYTSAHVFEALPAGGRIALQRELDDTAGVRIIRAHMMEVAQRFTAGDFSLSEAVHDTKDLPGVVQMRAARSAIRYTYRDLPRGGEVRLTTSEKDAIEAIHEFLRFQRRDHRSPGH